MSNNNIMLDLETMGTGSNAAIIAIGAVRFDFQITDQFYEVVDLQSCVDAGLEIEAQSVLWWMKQSDQARREFERPGVALVETLKMFADWIGSDALVWGNGAAFDNAVLANAYRKVGLKQPWDFWNDRCFRTVKAMYPWIKMERSGVHHNALDDAKSQAELLIRIWEKGNEHEI